MRFLDPIVAGLILVLRLVRIPLREAPGDWIVVLALFWIAQSFLPPTSKARAVPLMVAGLWLTAIYAVHQAPFTWTLIASR
ncbi:MAG TPA: hypothetical protein VE981_15250 [Planctomycetota bacterium]|nr:hypothetical protein [Planctomycetota bacterium]